MVERLGTRSCGIGGLALILLLIYYRPWNWQYSKVVMRMGRELKLPGFKSQLCPLLTEL
jgi:hypothetical protein